ncbi:MAG: winged helix-turn-helix domain-containing protein [Actinobacteria bacterium]|nr:winged helix-turn-helix domain-containing protein [Actinomycetota bacterium]
MSSSLTQLFGSSARVGILTLLLGDPDREFYLREIERLTGIQVHAVQVELRRLEGLGLIETRHHGNRKYVRIVGDHPLAPALGDLVRADRVRSGGTWPWPAPEIDLPHTASDHTALAASFDPTRPLDEKAGAAGHPTRPPMDARHVTWLLADACAVLNYLFGDHLVAAYFHGPYVDGSPTEESPLELIALVDDRARVADVAGDIQTLMKELDDAYGVNVVIRTLAGTDPYLLPEGDVPGGWGPLRRVI